jgi:VWFA-related protein
MKNFLPILFVCLVFTFNILAQIANPSPTPTKNEDDDVVIINTTLIQVDVTVTDKKGKIVKGLKPEDFEIYENDAKQNITNFSFVENLRKTSPKTADSQTQNLNIPITPLTPEKTRRTIALLVDDLNLSMESTNFVRRALKKFVEEQMQDGDLVAILRTGGGTGSLQKFTSDKRILLAAIEKIRWNTLGTGDVSAFPPIQPTFADMMKATNSNMSEESYQAALGREREKDNLRNEFFANASLLAINYIINEMKNLPGRKSAIVMSDGFAQVQTDRNNFPETANTVNQALKVLIDTANRNSVVVYTIDARGTVATDLGVLDNTGYQTRPRIKQRIEERNTRLEETQGVLRDIAKETGGIAIANSGDLNGGIEKMLNDQSYYLLAYQPDGDTFDAKNKRFNKLTVKVKNSDYQVRFRSGFFNSETNKSEANNEKPVSSSQKLSEAITSPFIKNDINLRLNAIFGNDAQSGNYVRSYLHIDFKDLDFVEQPNGDLNTAIDILAVAFDANGVKIEEGSKVQNLLISKESIPNAKEKGFVFNFQFPLKKAGNYQMRVAVRNHKDDKIGTANQFIELPDLKKENLAISGIILENLSFSDFQKQTKGETIQSDSIRDTSYRKFKLETVLRYGLEIYNAKIEGNNQTKLQVQIKIFQENNLIFEGKKQDLITNEEKDLARIKASGAFALGNPLKIGKYILQITVTDLLAKENYQNATQIIPIEIIQ